MGGVARRRAASASRKAQEENPSNHVVEQEGKLAAACENPGRRTLKVAK